ncbi:MAG: hypothetical protein JNL13_12750 [Chitinophagaceae bacterium]|nr:hypothetical protein [Chitinophagaceae bacterium]
MDGKKKRLPLRSLSEKAKGIVLTVSKNSGLFLASFKNKFGGEKKGSTFALPLKKRG